MAKIIIGMSRQPQKRVSRNCMVTFDGKSEMAFYRTDTLKNELNSFLKISRYSIVFDDEENIIISFKKQ